jgi:hypothetical protein
MTFSIHKELVYVPSHGTVNIIQLRNKSWKSECVFSFNMGWWILMIYPEPEARDNIYHYPSSHVKTQSTFILESINYFDSDMSKSTNTVVYFDWKTGINIYVCGICRPQFKVIDFSSGPQPVKIDSDQ